ncbi:DUF4260 family protein [Streptomyces sp. NPDC059477]|uniref:DUF4260 family protein n=1 Tax=Streptomyces sp. NPDC059477 TaxID=3346847 RepID=UPI0036AC0218
MKSSTLTPAVQTRAAAQPQGPTRSSPSGPLRALCFAAALFWTAFAILEGVNHGWPAILMAVVFFIAPDLTMLIAVREAPGLARGQLPARAVPYYNLAHRALIPFGLAVLYSFTAPKEWAPLFAALCAWLAHISYDRAFGYGLRAKDGFQRG